MKLTKEEVTALLFDVYFHLPKESASIGDKLRHHIDASEKETEKLNAEIVRLTVNYARQSLAMTKLEAENERLKARVKRHELEWMQSGIQQKLEAEIADLKESLREARETLYLVRNNYIGLIHDASGDRRMEKRLDSILCRLTEKEPKIDEGHDMILPSKENPNG